jgi:lysophospholipase L1-like esterase
MIFWGKSILMKKFYQNILAILIGLTLSFFLLEGLLRVFEPIEYRVKGNKIILPRDKKYLIPNDKSDKLDSIISYSRNHLGFRGEMPPRNFADSLTILTVGGSTTECLLISDGKTWSDILANRLKIKFKPCWLNNAGLDGNSTFGHITLMKDFIIKMHPKVLLFLVGNNDIGLEGYGVFDSKYLKKPAAGTLAYLTEKLLDHSEVLSYAINFQRYSKAKIGGLVHQMADFAHMQQIDAPEESVLQILNLHREKYLKQYEERLTKLIELSRQNSIEPVFVTQPMVFGDVIDPVTGVNLARLTIYPINGETFWRILELYNEVLRNTAAKHHVYLIDLAREMPKSTEYFYDACHFSNAGCQVVAAIIDKHLEPFLAEKYPQYLLSNHAINH